jgi:hypothetical protein
VLVQSRADLQATYSTQLLPSCRSLWLPHQLVCELQRGGAACPTGVTPTTRVGGHSEQGCGGAV